MKILFLCGGDYKYGTHRMALSLIQYIERNHPDVKFIVLTSEKGFVNDKCNELSIENYVISYRYCVYRKEKNIAFNALKRLLKGTYLFTNLRNSLRLLKKYVDIGKIDLIHTNNNRDLLGEYIAQKYNIPHIVHLREFSKSHFGLNLLFPNQLAYMNKYTDRFIAVSDAVKCDWEIFGIDRNKIVKIYDGVDENNVNYHSPKLVSSPIRIVMCGAIYDGKGQRQLVEAVHILKQRRFNVIVDFYGGACADGYYQALEDDIRNYDLEKCVHMNGYRSDVRQLIGEYDIGVVCSKAEGFGLVTVEYMLANLCPVVSDTGANKELVEDGESGLIYEWGNVIDLADKLEGLLRNPTEIIRLAGNARERAQERFSLKNSVDNLIELYRDVQRESVSNN